MMEIKKSRITRAAAAAAAVAVSGVVALGCGADDDTNQDAGEGSTGATSGAEESTDSGDSGSGSVSASETGMPSDDSSGGPTGPTNLEECIEDSAIDAVCEGDGPAFEYVVFSESLGCSGLQGAGGKQAQVLFSLEQTPKDGQPQVLGLRLIDPAGTPDVQLDHRLPEPTPYDGVTTSLEGRSTLIPSVPIVFESAASDTTVELESFPELAMLMDGEQTLTGRFAWAGATTQVDGNSMEDETLSLRGCFRLPAVLHPIELDD